MNISRLSIEQLYLALRGPQGTVEVRPTAAPVPICDLVSFSPETPSFLAGWQVRYLSSPLLSNKPTNQERTCLCSSLRLSVCEVQENTELRRKCEFQSFSCFDKRIMIQKRERERENEQTPHKGKKGFLILRTAQERLSVGSRSCVSTWLIHLRPSISAAPLGLVDRCCHFMLHTNTASIFVLLVFRGYFTGPRSFPHGQFSSSPPPYFGGNSNSFQHPGESDLISGVLMWRPAMHKNSADK